MTETFLAVGLTLTACMDPGPVHLTLAVDRTSLARAETVTMTVTLMNASVRTVSAQAPQSFICGAEPVEVTDGAARAVTFPRFGCIAIAYLPVEVPPGGTLEYTASWTPQSTSVDGASVAPGNYVVRGKVNANQRWAYSESKVLTVTP